MGDDQVEGAEATDAPGHADPATEQADSATDATEQADPATDATEQTTGPETDQAPDPAATEQADPETPDPSEGAASRDDEIAKLRDRLARARADYDNLQKRVTRDAVLERERVKARFVEGFLPVFEYALLAANEAEKDPGPLADGVKMVAREFERLLENEGVQRVGAVGEPFDALRHEALAEEDGGVEPGQVSRVVTYGYMLGERVLRYARVTVQPKS